MERRYFNPQVERLDRPELRRWQSRRLATILQAAERNPMYKDKLPKREYDLTKPDDRRRFAAEVPLLRKRDFVEDQRAAPHTARECPGSQYHIAST